MSNGKKLSEITVNVKTAKLTISKVNNAAIPRSANTRAVIKRKHNAMKVTATLEQEMIGVTREKMVMTLKTKVGAGMNDVISCALQLLRKMKQKRINSTREHQQQMKVT